MKRVFLLVVFMLTGVFAVLSFLSPANSSASLTLSPDTLTLHETMGTADVADDIYWVLNLTLFASQDYTE